jgi:hypothetical protein
MVDLFSISGAEESPTLHNDNNAVEPVVKWLVVYRPPPSVDDPSIILEESTS